MPRWLPRPGRLALRVAGRNLLVWRRYLAASAVGNFLDPLFYLVVLGMGLGRVVERRYFGDVGYMEFIAPGMVATTAMYTATYECTFGAYTRMTRQGTYHAMIVTPVGVDDVVAGEALFASFKAAVGAAAVLLVAAVLGLVRSPAALAVPLLAFFVGLFFASAAMVVTALSPSYEFFNYFFTLAVTPMFLFAGVFFPVERLPGWARAAAEALPLTHAVDAARGLMVGRFRAPLPISLAVLVVACAAAFVPATLLVRRRLIR